MPSRSSNTLETVLGKQPGDGPSDAGLRLYDRGIAERAAHWAQRIAEDGIDVDRVLRLLAAAVGAAPATIDALLACRKRKLDVDQFAAVAELVRRRPTDGFLEELGRAFLRRWVDPSRSPS